MALSPAVHKHAHHESLDVCRRPPGRCRARRATHTHVLLAPEGVRMNQPTTRIIIAFFATLATLAGAYAQEWQAPPPAKTSHRMEGGIRVTVVDASRPGTVVPQSTGLASMAGDDDGFGFGQGWVPPYFCQTFDNRGPEDLGVFDQRQPDPAKYNSICTFVGSWQQSFAVPPGGLGGFTVQLRILGGSTATSQCYASPCGCTTPSPQLLINGIDQPGFFTDPGCANITYWSKTFSGADAAIASGGTLNFEVHWNDQPFAIDWSKVIDVVPIVNVTKLDGDGQKAVIQNAAEKKLRVQLSCADPSFSLAGLGVGFQVTSYPPKATKYAVGADENATTTTYTATSDANGIASAVVVVGDVEGPYTVQATAGTSTSPPVTFTVTAQKPDSTAILKDSTDIADRADTYAVPSDQPTKLFAFGLDKAGQKIGPIKANWSTASSGSGATRGAGSVAPTTGTSSTTFTPSQVGHLTVSANPPISGIPTGKADLFLTRLYVEVQGFDPTNPSDQLDQFVPGSYLDGSSADPTSMPQPIRLHVLTGASSRGSVTFSLSNVTNYPGIAMNYPVSGATTDPDMYFDSGSTTTVPFSGSGDTVATLKVNDYAASGVLTITITSGRKTYSLASVLLPVDDDGNHIPDAGWVAENAQINDTGLDPAADEDDSPPTLFTLPDSYSGIGDALTNFEEYRGFVFMGAHRRLNPFHKDYFIEAATFNNDITFAYPALPTSTYQVGKDDYSVFGDVNINYAGLPGAASHQRQNVVRVVDLGFSPTCPTCGGETVCAIGRPHVPVNCSEIRVFSATIAATFPSDPVLLRRAVVAHEAGHSMNFFHDSTAGCLMYGGSLVETGIVPTEFCTGITTTLDCQICSPPSLVPVSNFNETDTLRLKP